MNAAILSFHATREAILAFSIFFAILTCCAVSTRYHKIIAADKVKRIERKENEDFQWPARNYSSKARYVGPKRDRLP